MAGILADTCQLSREEPPPGAESVRNEGHQWPRLPGGTRPEKWGGGGRVAGLIVKSPYIKGGGGGGYLQYIGTRERVEILPDGRPSTRKQEQLITKLAKDFPDTKTLGG